MKKWTHNDAEVILSGTAYVDNVEYPRGSDGLTYVSYTKVHHAEGYSEGSGITLYRYFRRDHLGNIREVVSNTGSIVQRTQYYPSGLPWAKNSGDDTGHPTVANNRKYNGKEWVEMHGLDEYDSEARWYYPAIMRTTTIDPLAEKFYDISPYAWCLNNPVNAIDPDGKFAFLIPAIPYVVPALKAAAVVGIAYFGAKTASEVSVVIRENSSSNETRTDNAKATTPQQRRHAREQEARSKQETADIKNKHQKMESNYNANGDGEPKRDPNEVWNLSNKVVGGVAIGTAIGVQLTNPDPSKDANDAKLEQAKQKEQNKNEDIENSKKNQKR